jgi:hypothetical protein
VRRTRTAETDERPASTEIPDGEAVVLGPRRYRALETLAPQAWSIELLTSSTLGQAASLRTNGRDVAGLHAWSLGATVGLSDGDLNLAAAYAYGELRLPVRLSLGRTIAERDGYRVEDVALPYTEETIAGSLSIGLPTRRLPEGSLSLSGDVDVDYSRLVDVPDGLLDPGDPSPRAPTSDYQQVGVALRGSWQNTRSYLESVGPAEGHELNTSIRYDDPKIGATFRVLSFGWTYRYYKKLWGESATFALRVNGGTRVADNDRGAAFGLGGAPTQDVVSAIMGTSRIGSTGYLRGYQARVVTGDTFHLANLEYRHRLWEIERGIATLPIYVRRLHVAGLIDAGTAYDDGPTRDELKYGLGGAIRLDVFLGWFAPGSFEVGYMRGLATEGIDETWLLLTTTL